MPESSTTRPSRRLQREYNRLQNRIDQMYTDKLDGRIDQEFFDRKDEEWRQEQEETRDRIEEHENANQIYIEEGIQLLELARHAHELFEKQEPREKRRLLNFVLSNSTWKDGELTVTYRQPFDMLAVATTTCEEKKAAGASSDDLRPVWVPERDANFRQNG